MVWAVATLVLLYGLWLTWQPVRMWLYLRASRSRPRADYRPRAAVIVPCWETDAQFADRMRALLEQDYPDYEVVFVTGSTADPAWPVLDRLARRRPMAHLVVSGTPSGRSQKVHNGLRALEEVSGAEVYVFADSDVDFPAHWLSSLVGPLGRTDVGAATGCFWLDAAGQGLWAQTLAWGYNTLVAPFFAGERLSLAWGGSMAIRASVFRETGVAEVWEKVAYDDLALAGCVRRSGLRLPFVPQAFLTVPIPDGRLRWSLDWLRRQMIAMRVYTPSLYWLGLLLSLPNLLMVLSPLILLAALFHPHLLVPALLMLSVLPMRTISGVLLCLVVDRPETARHAPLDYLAVATGLLATYVSAFTSRFAWGPLVYELLSPRKTRVLGAARTPQVAARGDDEADGSRHRVSFRLWEHNTEE